MLDKKGFTLIEMAIVIVIIGILASIALSNYFLMKENVLDKKAKSNLKMIRVAEKSYRMDTGNYYPSSGSVSDIATINQNLKLSLLSGSTRNWNYTVWSTGCSRATRNGGDGRSWYLTINDDEPKVGTGCP